MSQLTVKIPACKSNEYIIDIATGSLAALREKIKCDFPDYKAFIVTDSNVAGAGHLKTLTAGADVAGYVINPAGENSKNINTVIDIIETMEKAAMGRDALIIALGGGTVGDIAGFAAAIFKRGIGVIQIPTTTLAQADSSVGGKTGVDSSVSKNAFGAFLQPAAVYIDIDTLKTLDEREYKSGLVESVKHALIADAEYFDFFEKNISAILNRDSKTLEQIAYNSCRIKAAIVEQDPTEKNMRRILNYGHTIGHAVESGSSYGLLHGEAVAIGIVAAGLIEQKLGFTDEKQLKRIKMLLKALKMPVSIPKNMDKDRLVAIMRYDKKAVDAWPKFVLLEKLGMAMCREGQWAHDVPRQVVEEVLDDLSTETVK